MASLAWSEIQPPDPSGHIINDFCDLGGGVLVAVGTVGVAYRSTDGGATWASVTLAELNTMTALAYNGAGVLIAVSSQGTNRIQRSTDGGVSWSAIAAPVVAGWQSATWDPTNAKFVVVASSGAGNRTMNSADGSTWTSHAAAAAKAWSWVQANTAVVVAAAFGTSVQQIMTSTDGGATWALQTHTSWAVGSGVLGQGSSGLAWSAAIGVFAIGALNGATYGIITSANNGVTWTFQTIPTATTNRVVSLVAAPDMGALLGPTVRVAAVNTILISTNGTTWTTLDPTIYRDWTASGWSAGTDTFVSWDTSGHSPQTILLGRLVALDSISPARGTLRGDTFVTISGQGFAAVAQGDVLIGDEAALDVRVATGGLSLTCLTPAHATGAVDVTVTNIGTLTNSYTYVSVDRVTPRSGTTFGGTAVTLTGFGFDLATGVTFAGVTATAIVYVSNTSITCVTPQHSSGLVDVDVAGVDTLTGGYTYVIATDRLPPFPYAAPLEEGGSKLIGGAWAAWLRTVKARIESLPGDVPAENVLGVFGEAQIPQLPFSRLTLNAPRLLGRTTAGSGDSEEISVGASLSLANGLLNISGLPSGYAIGDLLYADSASTLARLADVTVGSYLRSGGVLAAPLWSTLTLPNAANSGDILKASGTNAYTSVAPQALTRVNDTNVTLTLTGTPASALVNATLMTLGWTGTLGVTRGGTGTGTAFTAGSVIFAGASGVYTQNNANLFWDDTNKRLGIGTAGPNRTFTLVDTVNGNTVMAYTSNATNLQGGQFWQQSNQTVKWFLGGNYLNNTNVNNGLEFSEIANVRMFLLTGGFLGIGVVPPTAVLHLKAGTATASTAPIKLTSGTLLTTAEAGAIEFLTDDYYATITTGAARKGIVLNNGTALTSGRVPFATTNGRVTDDATLVWDNTNKRLGIGAASPSARLDVTQSSSPVVDTTLVNGSGTWNAGTLTSTLNLYTEALALAPTATVTESGADGALTASASAKTVNLAGLTMGDNPSGAPSITVYGDHVSITGNSTFNNPTATGSGDSWNVYGYSASIVTTPTVTAVGESDRIAYVVGNYEATVTSATLPASVKGFSAAVGGNVPAGTHTGALFSVSGTAINNTGLSISASGGTANYGIVITNPSAGANNYAIYSTAGAQSYFAGALQLGAKATLYNNIVTAGWGLPAIQAEARSAAQTGAVASVATYTLGAADGTVIVTANVNVTVSTLHNFAVQVAYTDETNVAQTLTLPMAQLAGTLVTAITNGTGVGPYEGIVVTLRCKASTVITVKTAGIFTTVTYNVNGSIAQLG